VNRRGDVPRAATLSAMAKLFIRRLGGTAVH
jgi:hypothetical protein